MQGAVAQDQPRRRGIGRPRTPAPEYADLTESFEAKLRVIADTKKIVWPSPKWRDDPVGFCRQVLGIDPWSKQVEILEAIRDHKRVAVRSGHKCGKSTTAAIAALWFFCSFEDARVCMTSVTARQVDSILYREVRKLHSRAGHCVACAAESRKRTEARKPPLPKPCAHSAMINYEAGELARTGIKTGAPDFRELVGFTAREAEAVAGTSGKNILYLPDEASGIPRIIFEAIEGNRAGGDARIAMFSNPTQTDGVFFDAFEDPKVSKHWHQIHVSSEDTPNAKTGRTIVPGLANRAWVEEKREEWGEESALYKVRVKGEFVRNEEKRIVSLHLLDQAEERWESTPAEGRLHIGIDPAGESGAGDETVFITRRGFKVTKLVATRGLSAAAHLVHLLGLISEQHGERDEKPIVKVDRDGEIGNRVYVALAGHLERDPNAYDLVGIRGGEWAKRQKQIYERVRDEVWANTAQWLKEGGAIPEDLKLVQDLHAPEWIELVNGKRKATPKDEIRAKLDRSPDRADALGLAVWELPSWSDDSDSRGAQAKPTDLYETPKEINAYELDGVGRGDDDYGEDDGPPGDGVYS